MLASRRFLLSHCICLNRVVIGLICLGQIARLCFGAETSSSLSPGGKARELSAKPLVLATMSDVAGIAEAVAGDLISLQVVLPPGTDPHAFSLTSEDMERFQHARLIIYAHSQAHEFEAALRAALPSISALDWPDYAACGARLSDIPGYPKNAHGPWLNLENAAAIACAIANRLQALGLPQKILQARLALFQQELAALHQQCLRVAAEKGLRGRSVAAMIPGVSDAIANFGMATGAVLMSEGSGTVVGQTLQQATVQLRQGGFAAIVCPWSMREAKAGEAARQLAQDSGAPVLYVHFLDLQLGQETYLSQRMKDLVAVAALTSSAAQKEAQAKPSAPPLVLSALAGMLIGLLLGRLLSRPAPCPCGAGIFEEFKEEK